MVEPVAASRPAAATGRGPTALLAPLIFFFGTGIGRGQYAESSFKAIVDDGQQNRLLPFSASSPSVAVHRLQAC
ncbi:hypothetical protein GTW51_20975 [Aurantimonas aggregata]|uniref:Uncharacterized protein n=1 Tax=Aurantimonas aggregata TaxID=2047720 RepID=A0A6L9MN46_9HYPH|nr:hypothetical protein [Aurantimonas aggregata]NDV89145.1 hypothetical protein [Aurantimonas aggregata]